MQIFSVINIIVWSLFWIVCYDSCRSDLLSTGSVFRCDGTVVLSSRSGDQKKERKHVSWSFNHFAQTVKNASGGKSPKMEFSCLARSWSASCQVQPGSTPRLKSEKCIKIKVKMKKNYRIWVWLGRGPLQDCAGSGMEAGWQHQGGGATNATKYKYRRKALKYKHTGSSRRRGHDTNPQSPILPQLWNPGDPNIVLNSWSEAVVSIFWVVWQRACWCWWTSKRDRLKWFALWWTFFGAKHFMAKRNHNNVPLKIAQNVFLERCNRYYSYHFLSNGLKVSKGLK